MSGAFVTCRCAHQAVEIFSLIFRSCSGHVMKNVNSCFGAFDVA